MLFHIILTDDHGLNYSVQNKATWSLWVWNPNYPFTWQHQLLSEKSQLNCDQTTLLLGQRECTVVVTGQLWYSPCHLWAAHRIQTGCNFRSKQRYALESINKRNDYSVSLRAEAHGSFYFAFCRSYFWGCLSYFWGGFVVCFLGFIFSFLRMKNFTLRAGSTISLLIFLDNIRCSRKILAHICHTNL